MIRWGIIGAGNIAKRFLASLKNSENGYLYAIASYTKANRDYYAENYPDVKVYDNYDSLLEDENIDAVYVATRHNDHYPWVKEALKHKKGVLCEKPATLYYEQTKELCELAKENNAFFVEGMKTRFVPLVADIKDALDNGVIGDILRVETCFAYDHPYTEGKYLFDKVQGGILNDVSSYNIASIIDYIHSPLKQVISHVQFEYDLDVNDQIELVFESGQTGYIDIALNENKPKDMTIYGTKGVLKANPFYRPEKAIIKLYSGEMIELEKSYINDDFFTEIEEVHRCLNENKIESDRMTFKDSCDIAYIVEEIRKAFK